jgi:hypothetical protein
VATGLATGEGGGLIDTVDVRGAGNQEWTSMVGVAPSHPLVTGGGELNDNINERWSRVVTQPTALAGPAADTIATPDGGSVGMGHWTDVLNFKGSAAPYLLLLLIAIIYFSHLKLAARGSAGGFGRHVSAGAALS